MTNINENRHHSRPTNYTWLIGLAVVLAIAVGVYWTEISEFAHFAQMKNAFGL